MPSYRGPLREGYEIEIYPHSKIVCQPRTGYNEGFKFGTQITIISKVKLLLIYDFLEDSEVSIRNKNDEYNKIKIYIKSIINRLGSEYDFVLESNLIYSGHTRYLKYYIFIYRK